jgi:hypothetical protein
MLLLLDGNPIVAGHPYGSVVTDYYDVPRFGVSG